MTSRGVEFMSMLATESNCFVTGESEIPVTVPARVALSVREVAELLGVHRNTIYVQIKRGSIPVVYVGAKPLVPMKWVDEQFGH
jgi:excisionase family DNA binding protein